MPAELLISLCAVTLSVGLLSGTLTWSVLRGYAPERRRLRKLTARPDESPALTLSLNAEPSALAERICRIVPRSPARMGEMRRRLVAAGFRSPTAPVIYAASQIMSALTAGIVMLMLTGRPPIGILSIIGGFAVPSVWLSAKVRARGRVIRNGLPDVVDLLVVCLESGSGLDQAILKTGEELALAYPPLGDELALVANEIRAGKPRAQAFTNVADRTGVEDVRSLVAMLIQTDRYGTSIAQALRVHADLLRTRRRQRAEERAAKASVKLVFPLVLFLFPAFYILTLGPAMLQFMRIFLNTVSELK
jgi:tight adherence protein C